MHAQIISRNGDISFEKKGGTDNRICYFDSVCSQISSGLLTGQKRNVGEEGSLYSQEKNLKENKLASGAVSVNSK